MAKAKYITAFEDDVIRIGVKYGANAPTIARYIGRNKMTVYNRIAAMRKDGSIDDSPFGFVCDEIAKAMMGIDANG